MLLTSSVLSATSKQCFELTSSVLSTTSKQCFEQPAASFLVCSLIFIEYKMSREEEVKVYSQTLHIRTLAYPFYGILHYPLKLPDSYPPKIYSNHVSFTLYMLVTSQVLSATSKLFFEQPTASFLV